MSSGIETLFSLIEAATEDIAEIKTVHMGYIHELATGQAEYIALLIIPPKGNIPTHMDWNRREFDIRYFLIAQNVGQSGGEMTAEERVAMWGYLDNINKRFITELAEDPSKLQIVGAIPFDYNSGGQDSMLPDSVIWIEYTLKVKAYDC